MAEFIQELIDSKYHLSVSKRMYESYKTFPEKRFIIGIINELAKSVSRVIKAYLIRFKGKKLDDFLERISKKYLSEEIRINLIKVLEIEKAQKTTPVQFSKNDKIIMLVDGKYKILMVKRLQDFIKSVEEAIKILQNSSRQV